jgi:mono/diheme cytochrome c family protein
MSRNDVILGVVCAVLVGFSLIVSLVVPRTRPEFPGRRIGLFVVVAALLVLGMLVSVEKLGAEEGGEPEAPAAAETQPGTETTPPPSPATETSGSTDTGQTGTESEGEGGGGDAEKGKEVFASAGCGTCHTLGAANATGTVGPNLDDLKPSFDAVVSQVENGGGGMPAFKDQLGGGEIQDVAAFVVASTQR